VAEDTSTRSRGFSSIPLRLRERVLAFVMAQRNRLRPKTLTQYNWALCRLAGSVDLDDVAAVERMLTRETPNLRAIAAAYYGYCRFHDLPRPSLPARDGRRVLPKIPMETTLQASLAAPRRHKWQAYFRLLYETGARASEPFDLKVKDLEGILEREKIRLGTSKEGGYTTERELPISPLLAEQLRVLMKGRSPEEYVFRQTFKPDAPLNYHEAERVMIMIRRNLRFVGYNVQGLRFHGYRHAFATRLYHATKDLALVSRSLGHKDLETTMIYVHLRPDQPRRYDVVHVEIQSKAGIGSKIAEGWEIALQTKDTVFFRRPRWVP